jgi:type VI secretion system protein
MPRERSLLDRLRRPEEDRGRSIQENSARRVESIMENLRRLLNSRHGIAPTAPEYGIPDLSDVIHSFPEATARLRVAIQTAIETFEPRLRRVRVRAVESPDDPLSLHFEIVAEVAIGEKNASVWFETRVDSSGEVSVRS